MQTPQAFGSASSYGKKYALGNLLLIDDTQDADATNTHGKTSAPVAKSKLDVGDAAFEKAKAFIANGGYLVTSGRDVKLDLKMIRDAGMKL
jgi:hypothetical protein